jgi:hypothetical protein
MVNFVSNKHKRQWGAIIHDLAEWLTLTKHGIYYQTLQCQATVNLGWLLWSFRKIDTVQLQKGIFNLCNLMINLRYQNIITTQSRSTKDQNVRALHAIVDKNQADQASKILQNMYSFNSKNFPLCITM